MAIRKKKSIINKSTVKKVLKKKVVRKSRVIRTRNGGLWTEAEFWQKIRQSLRNMSRWWTVARKAKEKARRVYSGVGKRQKWEYKCNRCSKFFPEKGIAVHHKIEVGSLKCAADLEGFVTRLFSEDVDSYEILCHSCHSEHHHSSKR